MAGGAAHARRAPLSSLGAPIIVLVGIVVALAWYVTFATADRMMSFVDPMMSPTEAISIMLFLALLVVMMVAMMLPSALPMIVAYRGLTRLEGGRQVRPADNVGTALFVAPYFLVWGGFGVLALFGLLVLGLLGPLSGALALVPALVLLAAGGYQLTRAKEVCLSHCDSPMGFVMNHWRSGRMGAVRMGLRHAMYCIGCCWLFMIVLFVAGAMNLVWMGLVSIVIAVEKLGPNPKLASRGVAGILLILGGILAGIALAS